MELVKPSVMSRPSCMLKWLQGGCQRISLEIRGPLSLSLSAFQACHLMNRYDLDDGLTRRFLSVAWPQICCRPAANLMSLCKVTATPYTGEAVARGDTLSSSISLPTYEHLEDTAVCRSGGSQTHEQRAAC